MARFWADLVYVAGSVNWHMGKNFEKLEVH